MQIGKDWDVGFTGGLTRSQYLLDRFSDRSVIASVLFRTTKSVVRSLRYSTSVSWIDRILSWISLEKKKQNENLLNFRAKGMNACHIGMSFGRSRIFPIRG